jgi:hypothetical protein
VQYLWELVPDGLILDPRRGEEIARIEAEATATGIALPPGRDRWFRLEPLGLRVHEAPGGDRIPVRRTP